MPQEKKVVGSSPFTLKSYLGGGQIQYSYCILSRGLLYYYGLLNYIMIFIDVRQKLFPNDCRGGY